MAWVVSLQTYNTRVARQFRRKTMANEVDVQIGARIRKYRKWLGMSQETLANAICEIIGNGKTLSWQQIQKNETGQNRVSGSTLHAICTILNRSPNVILGWTKPDEGKIDKKILTHVAIYRKCSEKNRYAIDQLTRNLTAD